MSNNVFSENTGHPGQKESLSNIFVPNREYVYGKTRVNTTTVPIHIVIARRGPGRPRALPYHLSSCNEKKNCFFLNVSDILHVFYLFQSVYKVSLVYVMFH